MYGLNILRLVLTVKELKRLQPFAAFRIIFANSLPQYCPIDSVYIMIYKHIFLFKLTGTPIACITTIDHLRLIFVLNRFTLLCTRWYLNEFPSRALLFKWTSTMIAA